MGSLGSSIGKAAAGLFGGSGGAAGKAGFGAGSGPDFTDQYNDVMGKIGNAYSPYTSAGAGALPQLQSMLSQGFQPGDLTQTPGYQFTLNQGLAATQNQGGVEGSPFGGATAAAMQQYATGLAGQTYNDAFNRWQTQVTNLQNLAGLGANAAGSQAGNMAQLFSGLVGGQSNVYGTQGGVESSQIGRGGSFFGALSNIFGV